MELKTNKLSSKRSKLPAIKNNLPMVKSQAELIAAADLKQITVNKKPKKNTALLIICGALIGFINGFFGGGGGMLAVPLLVLCLGQKSKTAHATAIAVILPICLISAVVYLLNGAFKLSVGLPSTIGFCIGGAIGAFLMKKIKAKWLVKIFAFVILAAGVKLLFF